MPKVFLFLVVAPVAIDNQPTYVLNLSFPVERLQAMVRQTPLPPLVTVGVIGKDGQFLFRSKPPEDFVGRPAPPSLVAEMKTRREGSWRGESIDEPVHAAFSPVASSGWSVAAEIPATALYKPWRDALGEMIVALGIVLAVAALFALLAGRRIPQPLNILIRDTRALGEDLQIDSSEPLGVKEFARLRDAQKVAAKESTWRAKRNRL